MSANTTHSVNPNRFNIPFGMNTIVGLLAVYWLNILIFGGIQALQIVLGTILVLFVPGYLLLQLVDVHPDRFGVFVLSVVGVSTVVASLASILTATVLTTLGESRSISALPLAIMFSGIVITLLGLVYLRRGGLPHTGFTLPQRPHRHLMILGIPVAGILAAASMRWFGSDAGSYLFIALIAVSVLLLSRVRDRKEIYPFAIFAIILGLLLHRNFTSPHIIGADIQGMYAVADHVYTTGSWLPSMSGIGDSIPVMTLVPASIATLLGAPLAMTFKLFFVLLFAFVPLGVYYFSEELFDARIAFFAALFFSFYHLSFTLTPGKQLIAEFFAILALLIFSLDSERMIKPVMLAIFSAGIILTHYGVAYVFGLSLLFAAITLTLTRRLRSDFDGRISIVYPVVLLASATGWYAVTTPSLLDRIFSIPGRILAQLSVILTGGSIEQSGITYLSTDTSLLQYANILLYAALAALIGFGLLRLVVHSLRNQVSGPNITTPEYTAIAVPFFAFLGASYFLVLDIWADRVFQLALLVLASLIPLGYRFLSSPVRDRLSRPAGTNASVLLTVFLVTLLLFSSGFVFAAAGSSNLSTFNENANDLSFDEADMNAVEWLLANDEISQSVNAVPDDGTRLDVDAPSEVQIYTDPTSFHLFRSTLPSQYYTTEIVQLKNEWQPTATVSEIDSGYVFLRQEAIVDNPSAEGPYPNRLTGEEAAELRQLGTVVYEDQGVEIVEVSGSEE